MPKRESDKKKQAKGASPSSTQPPLLPGLGGEPHLPQREKPVTRHDMERLNRSVGKLLAEQNFKGIEEANAFLASLYEGHTIDEIIAQAEESPEDQAQDLAYRAMDSDSLVEMRTLYHKALELDPHCIDALLFKAKHNARSSEDYTARLRTIVRDAEERFGAEYMEKNRGHFWGLTETRPYMRARQSLVLALEESAQISEATAECEGMLALNPNDNQGMRDFLRGFYLETGNIEGVRRLNKKYAESMFATCIWSAVLERWLSGNVKQAEKRARAGHKQNPHVAAYLTGVKKTPKTVPQYYSPGDAREAIGCAHILGRAWKNYPEAVAWLKGLALK